MKRKTQKQFDKCLNTLHKVNAVIDQIEEFKLENNNCSLRFSDDFKNDIKEALKFIADINTKYVDEDFEQDNIELFTAIKKEEREYEIV